MLRTINIKRCCWN